MHRYWFENPLCGSLTPGGYGFTFGFPVDPDPLISVRQSLFDGRRETIIRQENRIAELEARIAELEEDLADAENEVTVNVHLTLGLQIA